MKQFNAQHILTIGILTVMLAISGCKKLVDIPPPTDQLVDNNVFTNDETAISVLTGIYASMSTDVNLSGQVGISLLTGLAGDELTLDDNFGNSFLSAYYTNSLSATPNIGSQLWVAFYSYVYKCNAAIEGLEDARALTPLVQQQLMGEAKFVRAFCYFYLINLYGDIPLVISTDYKQNALLSRAPKMQIYEQLIKDLQDAKNLLSNDYLDGHLKIYDDGPERSRPTKWVASSLLSRVYLYLGNYADAASEATNVINQTQSFGLAPLSDVFLMNSVESIWQLQPIIPGHNTEDALAFIIPETGPSEANAVYLSPQLLQNFEIGDQRLTAWIDSITVSGTTYYYPYKYKSGTIDVPLTEYLMLFRLGEQYLIRAEAQIQQNNISEGQEDLNAIRNRAGLPATNASDRSSLLAAIEKERRSELFTEWGHRWLDLKRTGNLDGVMSNVTPIKSSGLPWNSYQQLFPLPISDIQNAPNLVQNDGYQ